MPIDIPMERIVLSAAINSQVSAAAIFADCSPEDFFDPQGNLLFTILRNLHREEKPLDCLFIFNALKSMNKEKELPLAALMEIAQFCPLQQAIEKYIEGLKNLTCLRKIINLSKESMLAAANKAANSQEIIEKIQENVIQSQGSAAKSTRAFPDIVQNFSDQGSFQDHLAWIIERRSRGLPAYEGISSGYPILDETLGFFRKSCIYYIGARTSMGKTTFILNLMHNMRKHSIGFFSLEMPAKIITEKLLCIAADVKYSHYEDGILFPEKVDRLIAVSDSIKDIRIFIEDPGTITIQQLRIRAKRLKINFGIEILFIDYITRIRSGEKKNTKHQEVDEISKALQSLAKELDIPIICLAQLNRASAGNESPNLTDFRESGSIEEDGDACIFLHRPDYYNSNEKPGVVQVKVAKNRIRGTTKTIEFHCDKLNSDRYSELPSIEQVRRDEQAKELGNFMENFEKQFGA